MLFNAAKDLVYTVDGNKITSGGYRINKILGSNTTKKWQKGGKKHYSEKTDFFNEDSGIPVGLLLLQSQHKYLIRSPSKNGNNQKNFVYIVNEDESEHENQGENEELVIVPQSFISSSSLPSVSSSSSSKIMGFVFRINVLYFFINLIFSIFNDL